MSHSSRFSQFSRFFRFLAIFEVFLVAATSTQGQHSSLHSFPGKLGTEDDWGRKMPPFSWHFPAAIPSPLKLWQNPLERIGVTRCHLMGILDAIQIPSFSQKGKQNKKKTEIRGKFLTFSTFSIIGFSSSFHSNFSAYFFFALFP